MIAYLNPKSVLDPSSKINPSRPSCGGNANGLPPWQSKSTPCASLAKGLGYFNQWAVLLHDPRLHMPSNKITRFFQLGKWGKGTWGVRGVIVYGWGAGG
nr:hypothetical protein [Tanacetum cinerariifolium]